MSTPAQQLGDFWDDLVDGRPASSSMDEPELAELVSMLHSRAQRIAPGAEAVAQTRTTLLLARSPSPAPRWPVARRPEARSFSRRWPMLARVAAVVLLCAGAIGAIWLMEGTDHKREEQIAAPDFAQEGMPTYLGNAARSGVMAEPGPISTPIERWRFAFGDGDALLAPPVTTGGLVFAGSERGRVAAFDAATGDLAWSVELGGAVRAAPVVHQGRLVVPVSLKEGTAEIVSLDAASGRERWRVSLGGSVLAALAASNGTVVVASEEAVTALDGNSGERLWMANVGGPVLAAPAIANGLVIIANRNKVVSAVDIDTGEIAWQYDRAVYPLWSAPVIHEQTIYLLNQPVPNVGSNQNLDFENAAATLIALDLGSGDLVWQQSFDWAVALPPAQPVAIDGSVNLFSINHQWQAFDANTGGPVQVGEQPEFGHTTYLVAGGELYLGGRSSALAAVDLTTMTTLWTLAVGGNDHVALTAPVVDGGLVFVGDAAGVLHAMGVPDAAMETGVVTPSASHSSALPERWVEE